MRFFFIVFIALSSLLDAMPSKKDFSEEERELLNYVLRDLVLERSMGYTLFGNKPMYWEPFREIDDLDPDFPNYQNVVLMNQAASALKKLSCESKKFKIEYNLCERENGQGRFHDFCIINKKALKNILKQHQALFCEKTGLQLSAQQIYDDILNQRCTYLNNQTALFGILLGYGAINSIEREEFDRFMEEAIASTDLELFRQIEDPDEEEEKWLAYLEQFAQIHYEKWGEFYERSKNFGNQPVTGITMNFSYCPTTRESQEIIKDYKKAEKKIKKFLESEDLLGSLLKVIN